MSLFEQKFAFYNKSQFEMQHQRWLDSIFSVKELKQGRKSVKYNNESSRPSSPLSPKWRKINDIRQIYSHAEIQQAFLTGLHSNGNSQLD